MTSLTKNFGTIRTVNVQKQMAKIGVPFIDVVSMNLPFDTLTYDCAHMREFLNDEWRAAAMLSVCNRNGTAS